MGKILFLFKSTVLKDLNSGSPMPINLLYLSEKSMLILIQLVNKMVRYQDTTARR